MKDFILNIRKLIGLGCLIALFCYGVKSFERLYYFVEFVKEISNKRNF